MDFLWHLRVMIDMKFIFKRLKNLSYHSVRDLHLIRQIGARGNVRSRLEYALTRRTSRDLVITVVIYSLSGLSSFLYL